MTERIPTGVGGDLLIHALALAIRLFGKMPTVAIGLTDRTGEADGGVEDVVEALLRSTSHCSTNSLVHRARCDGSLRCLWCPVRPPGQGAHPLTTAPSRTGTISCSVILGGHTHLGAGSYFGLSSVPYAKANGGTCFLITEPIPIIAPLPTAMRTSSQRRPPSASSNGLDPIAVIVAITAATSVRIERY